MRVVPKKNLLKILQKLGSIRFRIYSENLKRHESCILLVVTRLQPNDRLYFILAHLIEESLAAVYIFHEAFALELLEILQEIFLW